MCKQILALALSVFLLQTAFAGGPVISTNEPGAAVPTGNTLLQAGRVEGSVSDPAGAKVANARVALLDLTGAVIAETKTDAQGRFSFADVAPGPYTLRVEAEGFTLPDRPNIEVKKGATQTLSLKLEIASISEKVDVSSTDPIYVGLRQVKLSGESVALKNVVLKRDAGIITFKDGVIHFLAPVEGRVTGAVFLGDGEFELTPPLEIEKKHLANLTSGPKLSEQFSKVVFRFTDGTYDELKKQGTPTTGPVDSSAQGSLDDVRTRLRKTTGYNLEARIFTDLSMPTPGGLFQAYFNGKKYGNWLFAIDALGAPFVTPEEVVLINTSDSNGGIWSAFHINQHYRSPKWSEEDHRLFDILHQNIDARITGKKIEATVQTKFKSLVDGVRVLPLDLFRTLRVGKVTDEAGHEVRFIQEKKNEDPDFYVVLGERLKLGQEFTLTFNYSGEDVVLDAGGGNFALNPGGRSTWYPNNAITSFGDRSTFDITLRTAKGLVMVATGQPVGEATEGEFTITKWKSDVPLQVAGFNFGRFKKGAVQDEKLKFAFETYANKELPDDLKDLQSRINMAESQGVTTETTLQSLNTTGLMDKARAEAQVSVQLYTDVFGALPYGRIAMTQQPFPNFGQAWPMLVYMPLTAFLDSTHRHQLGMTGAANFFKFVGAHEVAHQWWGHLLGWNSYRDQWMSEGFAEFSASLFAQVVYKDAKFIEFWKEQRELINEKNRLGKRPSEVGSVYMGYRLNTAKTGNVTRAMIYPKGGFILHMIRMMMWDPQTKDQRFILMMRDFVQAHYNQDISTQDFQRAVEKHMTRDMDLDGNGKMNWFFQQYVFGTNIPEYKLDYRVDEADGKAVLVGKVTQSNVDDAFKMRVPLYADIDGKVRRLGVLSLFGNSSTEEFRVPLPKKPRKVMLNYYEDVLSTGAGG
ncbi:MAG TPA: carboxypeptidase regulatory-like domain-containing protein [Blastocatellia bacterium]|nr:carboxypeptidase regulatory-like domain-containing protein [Blastocatellia bacterium]